MAEDQNAPCSGLHFLKLIDGDLKKAGHTLIKETSSQGKALSTHEEGPSFNSEEVAKVCGETGEHAETRSELDDHTLLLSILRDIRGVKVELPDDTCLYLSDVYIMVSEMKLKHQMLPGYPLLEHSAKLFLESHFKQNPDLRLFMFSNLTDKCSLVTGFRINPSTAFPEDTNEMAAQVCISDSIEQALGEWHDLGGLLSIRGSQKDPVIFFAVYPEEIVSTMDSDISEVYDRLMKAIGDEHIGTKLARIEKAERGIDDNLSYVYGQVCGDDFGFMFLKGLQAWRPPNFSGVESERADLLRESGIFYDLGSGIGIAIFVAAMFGGINSCIGIEYLELLKEITIKAENLQPGSVVISVSEPLFSSQFEIIHASYQTYQWGDSATFIQRRKHIL